MRIAIIDDHDVVHAGIRAWCADADPPIEVLACFLRSAEYFAADPSTLACLDVVLLEVQTDGNSPDFRTLEILADTARHVIVYTHLNTDEVVLTCLDSGAASFVSKAEGKRHLIEAIHAAATETAYVGPRMGKALLSDSALGRIKLSQREKQVLVAWFQTDSKELVAKRLFIAPTTVRTHLQRTRAKYAAVGRAASTKSALLARAIEDGILGLNDL